LGGGKTNLFLSAIRGKKRGVSNRKTVWIRKGTDLGEGDADETGGKRGGERESKVNLFDRNRRGWGTFKRCKGLE